jgi:GT2 family glycosyltransferase
MSLSKIDFRSLGIQVKAYIWDNACAVPAPPVGRFLPFAWCYYSSPNNEPLSKIYNTLIRISNHSHILIFDQDSTVDEVFFRHLASSINRGCADIYVPVIRHSGRTISPGRLNWIKGGPLRGVVSDTMLPFGFTAMMSGLCIRRKFLVRLGQKPFDERLRLYGVDTRFCRDLGRVGGKAFLTGAVLPHDSALRSTTDPRAALQRRVWLWQSWLHVFDNNLIEVVAIRCYVLWKAWRATRGKHAPGRFLDVVSEVFH